MDIPFKILVFFGAMLFLVPSSCSIRSYEELEEALLNDDLRLLSQNSEYISTHLLSKHSCETLGIYSQPDRLPLSAINERSPKLSPKSVRRHSAGVDALQPHGSLITLDDTTGSGAGESSRSTGVVYSDGISLNLENLHSTPNEMTGMDENVKKGAQINPQKRSFLSATILHRAVSAGAKFIVKKCLALGADPNTRNVFGETPLHLVTNPHFSMVTLLEEYGADVNALDSDLFTPLMTATTTGNDFVALHLVTETGANIHISNRSRFLPINYAGFLKQWDLVGALVSVGASVDSLVIGNRPLLHMAVLDQNPTALRNLLELRANPDIQDSTGNTALHLAFSMKIGASSPLSRVLCQYGADPNILNFYGQTPQQLAAAAKSRYDRQGK